MHALQKKQRTSNKLSPFLSLPFPFPYLSSTRIHIGNPPSFFLTTTTDHHTQTNPSRLHHHHHHHNNNKKTTADPQEEESPPQALEAHRRSSPQTTPTPETLTHIPLPKFLPNSSRRGLQRRASSLLLILPLPLLLRQRRSSSAITQLRRRGLETRLLLFGGGKGLGSGGRGLLR